MQSDSLPPMNAQHCVRGSVHLAKIWKFMAECTTSSTCGGRVSQCVVRHRDGSTQYGKRAAAASVLPEKDPRRDDCCGSRPSMMQPVDLTTKVTQHPTAQKEKDKTGFCFKSCKRTASPTKRSKTKARTSPTWAVITMALRFGLRFRSTSWLTPFP